MTTRYKHALLAFKALAALAAGLTLSACSGHGLAPDSQRDSSQALSLDVLPDTYVAGGKAASIEMRQSEADGQTVVEVVADKAESLKGLYFTLNYDPALYTPVDALPGAELAPKSEVLQLSDMSKAGAVQFGEIVIRPQDKSASGAGKGYNGSGMLAVVHFAHKPFAAARQVSSAPTTNASKTTLSFYAPTAALQWQYFSQGDYNQNGEVGISDLTPLGIHFNETVPLAFGVPDMTSIQSVVDGDGNGQITLADLTPIGQNFGNAVGAYRLYSDVPGTSYPASNGAADSIAEFDTVAFSTALGAAASERLGFSYIPASPAPAHFWVRPADGGGNPGTPSNDLDLSAGIPNSPPVVDLQADITSGTLPLTVHFTAPTTDANGDTLEFRWDFDNNAIPEVNTGALNVCDHVFNDSGTWTVRCDVWDGNDFGYASLDIIVSTPGGNVAPTVHVAADITSGFSPFEPTFTATVVDPDIGQTYDYQWDFDNDGSIDLDSGADNFASSNYGYDDITGGYFTCRVVVSDGFDTGEATCDIQVNPPDNPPVVNTFIVDVETGPAPLAVHFTCGASDMDGDGISYLWDFGDGVLLGGSEEEDHVFPAGEYDVHVRVEDGIEGTNGPIIHISSTP